jgi:hypothetical protein
MTMTGALVAAAALAAIGAGAARAAQTETVARHGVSVTWTLEQTFSEPDPDKGVSAQLTSKLEIAVGSTPQLVQHGPPQFAHAPRVVIARDRTVVVRWTLRDDFALGNVGLELAAGRPGAPLNIHLVAGSESRWLPSIERPGGGVGIRWLQTSGRLARLRTAVVRGTRVTHRRTLVAVPGVADAVGEILVRRNTRGDQLITWNEERRNLGFVRIAPAGRAFGRPQRIGPGTVARASLSDRGRITVVTHGMPNFRRHTTRRGTVASGLGPPRVSTP